MEIYASELLKTVCQWMVLAAIITALAARYWQCRHRDNEADEIVTFTKRSGGGRDLRNSGNLSGRATRDANSSLSYAQDERSLLQPLAEPFRRRGGI